MNRRVFLRNANMAAASLATGGGLLGCVKRPVNTPIAAGVITGESARDGLPSATGQGVCGPGDSNGGGIASFSAVWVPCGEGDGGGHGRCAQLRTRWRRNHLELGDVEACSGPLGCLGMWARSRS